MEIEGLFLPLREAGRGGEAKKWDLIDCPSQITNPTLILPCDKSPIIVNKGEGEGGARKERKI